MPRTWTEGDYEFSPDKTRIDVERVRQWLDGSYWAKNIPEEIVRRAIDGSISYGIYDTTRPEKPMIGFGRLVTDGATFAWFSDIFVDEAHRGKGLARRLVEGLLQDEQLSDIRRWVLATKDAHGVYEPCGFTPLKDPDWWMEIVKPNPYGG